MEHKQEMSRCDRFNLDIKIFGGEQKRRLGRKNEGKLAPNQKLTGKPWSNMTQTAEKKGHLGLGELMEKSECRVSMTTEKRGRKNSLPLFRMRRHFISKNCAEWHF